jgi:hypothetical protein
MIALVTLIFLVSLTYRFAALLIKGADREWVFKVMLGAWLCLFPLLALVNLWFPFTGGGDDEDYFYLAAVQLDYLADYFDLTRYIGLMEQAGYPTLLSALYQFTGEDLLAFKLLNLAFFVMLIPIWYRIGVALESRAFGRAVAVAIVLITPLWYYGFFILKDMSIVLLQSAFLLGVVHVCLGDKGSWLLCLVATVALIPFRSHLVLVNMAVLSGAVALTSFRRAEWGKIFTTLIIPSAMLAIVLAIIFYIVSSFELMASMGVYTAHRVIGTVESQQAMAEHFESSEKRTLFPFLYLFTETAGLNPQTWADFDATALRGLLALPWIFVGVPFFLFGLRCLMRADPRAIYSGGVLSSIQSLRLLATPWAGLLMFILAYMAVSWTTGDTTRWRMSDVPAMVTIAVYGWENLERRVRLPVLLLWLLASGSSFLVYYSTPGL